ncbi:MAG TPA: cupin domain-containing protein [Anaerolineales bacterium]|nr:cupin domain-containing protein [Anaerolineales bacterium]
MITAEDWIARLRLRSHPEGGYFAETYRSVEEIAGSALPERYAGQSRKFSTAIYYLLRFGQVSHFHRLHSDEIWHFYAGQPVSIHSILPNGQAQHVRLGQNPHLGHQFQAIIPAGTWFGAVSNANDVNGYSLVGCTVSPGFDFTDFELAEKNNLLKLFPQHAHLIEQFTKK